MIWRVCGRSATMLAVLALAACHSTSTPNPPNAAPSATPTSASSAPMVNQPGALFYAKAGSLYVSDPAGTPGRKLTDGPADTQPAPSPDRSHVAFVRKAKATDYGGELWVLDLSPQLTPVGQPRRLVDPATLPRGTGDSPLVVVSPQWSPTGQHVAFVGNDNNGIVDGGTLLVAAADTGALTPAQAPIVAGSRFRWSPGGNHIVWVNARSDVRPVDVNAFTVGGSSTPLATDTNAYSATYSQDGQTVLFTNAEASGPDFTTIPFALRDGGIYSVATLERGAKPTPVFSKRDSYFSDIAALNSGAVAFTAEGTDNSSRVIQIIDNGSSVPHTTVTDVAAGRQGPAWGAGDYVGYLNTSAEIALVVTDLDNRNPKQVDTGVDAFAWAP